MKLACYVLGGEPRLGVTTDDGIIEVGDAPGRAYPTIRAVIEKSGFAEIAAWTEGRDPDHALDKVRYLPPLHDARKVICVGVNYAKRHPVHGEMPPPENITLFNKWEGALVGHLEPLIQPPAPAAETFDYEGELVLVIGPGGGGGVPRKQPGGGGGVPRKQPGGGGGVPRKQKAGPGVTPETAGGRAIPKEKAFDHIAGYTIMNDGSVRAWQKHSVPAGKNFTGSGASGPCFVTADEIADPSAMRLSTRLNGEEVQSATVADMIFDIPTIINYVSTIVHLAPGDIIATGSPSGSGGSRQPQRFLEPGDELEIEWSGVGCLKNRVSRGGERRSREKE